VTVETVISTDGTRIACWCSGEGPPLVFLHGAAIDHREFSSLAPWLEPHFSVWAVDRRGRGASGDGPEYAIEREFEDLAAVVDAIGAEVNIVGQSYGATVALGALPLVPNMRRAVLFDPRANVGGDVSSWADELDAMLAAGEHGEILMKIYRAVLPEMADSYRASPEFEPDLSMAHTIPRESRTNDYRPFDPRPYAAVDTPVLFLTGSASAPEFHRTIEAAHAVLPNSKVTVLAGHDHVAIWKAPELVARHIIEFLRDDDQQSRGTP
jgi:pimeloyl-ACP methyl ester carboxylesterase